MVGYHNSNRLLFGLEYTWQTRTIQEMSILLMLGLYTQNASLITVPHLHDQGLVPFVCGVPEGGHGQYPGPADVMMLYKIPMTELSGGKEFLIGMTELNCLVAG